MIEHSIKTVVRDALLLAIALGLLWWFQQALVSNKLMSGDNVRDTITWIVIVLISVVTIFSAYFVLEALFLAPRAIWLEAKTENYSLSNQVESLTKRLSPKLTITAPPDGGAITVNLGTTSETIGGYRQTVITSADHFVTLYCRNDSEESVVCEARLISAWRIINGEKVDLNILETIQLSWSRKKPPSEFLAVITPRETKRLYIALIRPNGAVLLYRTLDEIPTEYHQLFYDTGHYLICIQIDISNNGAKRVLLEMKTAPAKKVPNQMPIPGLSLSVIDQDYLQADKGAA